MRLLLLASSLFCLIVLGAALPTSAADAGTWSLDEVRLGANVDQVIASRSKPSRIVGNFYYWDNAAGGVLTIEADRYGNIADIHVHGGPKEIRTVLLPASPPEDAIALGKSGHVNYDPPPDAVALDGGLCTDLGFEAGKPCESFTLRGGAILVVNFGNDTGTADGLLSDVILAAPGYFGSSVRQLSQSSVTRLVQLYFKDHPPVVYLGDVYTKTRLNNALAASGLFSSYSTTGSCGDPLAFVALTVRGREVASQRAWIVSGNGYAVRIPLGSFSLVTESLTYAKRPNLPGTIHFVYWFKGSANVPYLLSLAPATAWGSVGMNDGAGVSLDKANRLVEGTLPIMWDNGWVIDRDSGDVGILQC